MKKWQGKTAVRYIVTVEADYRAGILRTRRQGVAVLPFLGGLHRFVANIETPDSQSHRERLWFEQFESRFDQPLSQLFEPILHCMWHSRIDFSQFREDEFEWYWKRHMALDGISEDEFKALVKYSKERWSDIDAVIAEVKLLMDIFKQGDLQPLEGCYDSQNTLADFEDLDETLEILVRRGYKLVRLSFSNRDDP
jgi:hypothetical protein